MTSIIETTIERVIGLVLMVIGAIVLCAEYMFFSALLDVFSWAVAFVNAPESAALVLTVLAGIVLWIVVLIVSLIGALGIVIGWCLLIGWIDLS
jgi:hypothetical protein